MGSSGVVGFTRVGAGVVGFIRYRGVHLGLRWGSLGSFRVVGFSRVRPRGSWVHLVSLGSLGFALVVVGFALGVFGFIRGR